MINLLPKSEKEFLQIEETKKLIVILGAVVLGSLICLILILFSVKIYISGQAESQRIILLEAEKEFKQSESQILQEKINWANLTFSQLSSFYQQKLNFTEVLEKISKTLPPGIYLTNLSLNPLTGEQDFKAAQISLSGFAPDRETLFEFKKTLESEVNFKEIYFPPTNWIKPAEIDFNITLKWISF